MDLDPTALRKLLAGVVAILLASGVIKWKYIESKKTAKIALYVIGIFLVVAAAAYQFDFIPDDKTDLLIKKLK